MGQFFILRSRKFVNWNNPVFLKRYSFICSTYTSNECFFIISNNFKQKKKPWSTILSPSPSPSGTFWTRSRLPRAYLSKMAESALAARAKIRPPCTLKHRVQQEYALNRIFKSNLSLNNFKWLLTKLELSCVRNIIPRSRKLLWNGYPVLNQELQNHDPVGWHIPV